MDPMLYTVDAFTARPFAGNPAAVCLLDGPGEERGMQCLAKEMNLSETAFVYPIEGGYHLRWFTPAAEVDLCGHATLATAHVLWEEGHLQIDEPACFQTRSGTLNARRMDDWIELDFPADPVTEVADAPGLTEALGTRPRSVHRGRHSLICELPRERDVLALDPDFRKLQGLPAVAVTSQCESDQYDFISRFFAPGLGVNEDPVTGSAHCSLGPFWAERLGKTELVAYQASQRGGVVRVGVAGSRVRLGGQAITVMRGRLIDCALPKISTTSPTVR